MRKFLLKNCIVLVFLFLKVNVEGQQSCPLGYEVRNIKCGQELIEKCVPVDYSCAQCWGVHTISCPNVHLPGSVWYPTYQRAYEAAERDRNNALRAGASYLCIGNDPREYFISLDDGKFCTNNSGNSNNITGGTNSNGSFSNNDNNPNNNNPSKNRNSTTSYGDGSYKPQSLQLQAEIQFFYVQHHNAEEELADIKKKFPAKAAGYENDFNARMQQLLNYVKEEAAKSEPSLAIVKSYRKQLDNIYYQIVEIGNKPVKVEQQPLINPNNSKSQTSNSKAKFLNQKNGNLNGLDSKTSAEIESFKQNEYEVQAESYFEKGMDKEQSYGSRLVYLETAKMNARLANNTSLIQKIEDLQSQLRREQKDELVASSKQFVRNIFELFKSNNQESIEEKVDRELGAQKVTYKTKSLQNDLENKINESLKDSESFQDQFEIDSLILTNSVEAKHFSTDIDLDTLYYFKYARNYQSQKSYGILLSTYFVVKLNNEFPSYSELKKRAGTDQSPAENGVALLIGFYKSLLDLQNVLDEIEKNAQAYKLATLKENVLHELK